MSPTSTLAMLSIIVVAMLVALLFAEHRKVTRALESRIESVEQLREPFASRLSQSFATVPMTRVVYLNVHLDEQRFWFATLGLSHDELIRIREEHQRPGKPWHGSGVRLRLQEWRGGYAHVLVKGPLANDTSAELDCGCTKAGLWRIELPVRGQEIVGAHVDLTLESSRIKISARGGRFGFRGFTDNRPKLENTFLDVALREGPEPGESHEQFHKIEAWPDVCQEMPAWTRYYHGERIQHGISWDAWIYDYELFVRSEGNASRAEMLLLEH